MQVKLTPECPTLFIDEPLSTNLSITGKKSTIQWVAAQITGTVKSLNQSSRDSLHSLIIGARNIQKDTETFVHVVSGTRMIEMDANIPNNYLITLKASNIPPSYYGPSIEISYKLSVLVQERGKQIITFDFPIFITAPFNKCFDLGKVQQEADFDIDAMKCDTRVSYKTIFCPFNQTIPAKIETTALNTSENHSEILNIQYPTSARQGDLIDIIVNKGEDCPVVSFVLELIVDELNSISGIKEIKVLSSENVDLREMLMKKIEFQVPRLLSIFSTEIFTVSYKLRFTGVLPSGQGIQTSKEISIYPIKILNTSQYTSV